MQLAAQVPFQWRRTRDAAAGAELAIRKVAYRALLERVLDRADGRGARLGRLNDATYVDWTMFLGRAREKLCLDEAALGAVADLDRTLEQRVRVFHVLRCILGPTVESLILLDRLVWMQEALEVSFPLSGGIYEADNPYSICREPDLRLDS